MALIFADSCDRYSASADLEKFWSSVNITDSEYNSSKGRYGGGCIICYDDTFNMWKNFPVAGTAPTTDELFVSFWFNAEALPAAEEAFITFQNAEAGYTFTYGLTPTGVINARRGGATGTILAASPAATISAGAWYRIESRLVIHGSTGLYELRVNGTAVIGPTTGTNTLGSTSSVGATNLVISGNNNATLGFIFDDIIVHDSSGSAFNGFLGQARIETVRPDGAGDSSNGTANGAATRHEAVDEAGTYDSDTTYVALTTSGDENLYTAANLSGSPATVHAVVVNTVAKATAGPRSIRSKVKHSTSEGDGDTQDVASGTYGYVQHAFVVNPSTSTAWTASEVNAMQIGFEVVS